VSKLKFSLLSSAIVAVIVGVVLQQRMLNRLRDENAGFRQQHESAGQLATVNEQLSNSLAQTKASLSDDQKRELLRLRGEVSGLRKQTNELARIHEDNRRLRQAQSARPKIVSESEPEEPPDEARRITIAKITDSRLIVLGLIMHAADHGGEFANSFDQLTNYLKSAESKLTGTNVFDFVYSGKLDALSNPSSTIVVREHQATQLPDGKWGKAYGFADGHSEYHSEPDGNFDAWEKPRIVTPPSNP